MAVSLTTGLGGDSLLCPVMNLALSVEKLNVLGYSSCGPPDLAWCWKDAVLDYLFWYPLELKHKTQSKRSGRQRERSYLQPCYDCMTVISANTDLNF